MPTSLVAVSGLGSIGLQHVQALISRGDIQVAGFDPAAELRDRALERGVRTAAAGFEALLDLRPDALVIAAPDQAHLPSSRRPSWHLPTARSVSRPASRSCSAPTRPSPPRCPGSAGTGGSLAADFVRSTVTVHAAGEDLGVVQGLRGFDDGVAADSTDESATPLTDGSAGTTKCTSARIKLTVPHAETLALGSLLPFGGAREETAMHDRLRRVWTPGWLEELGQRAVNCRRLRWPAASVVAAVGCAALVAVPSSQASEDTDPALRVVDKWYVTSEITFPDGARAPALAEAPNGDLIVKVGTSGDFSPGGEIHVIRSHDQGRTWGASELVATSKLFGDEGSVGTRSIATLRSGEMLLPYNDAVNHVNFNNRESKLFIARSSDNGETWTGTDEPVDLPRPIREAWVHSNPLELADGTILLPIWGALELVDDWETNPMRWRSGVLRSFDGGETWTDYRTIAYDPNNPPQYPPFHTSNYTSGANEVELQPLPDGRIAAIIRYAAGIGPNRGQVYLSYSSNRGATWTPPVATAQQAEALTLTTAPCSDELPSGRAKIVMGHRYLENGRRVGRAALHVSFDGGVTWEGRTFLEDPGGATHLGTTTGEPAFYHLNDDQLLVIFHARINGGPPELIANIVEDASDPAVCRAQAESSAGRAEARPTFFVERADRDEWAWPLAVRKLSYPSTTLVRDVLSAEAPTLVGCDLSTPDLELRLRGQEAPLALDETLAEAGVTNGAVLELAARTAPRPIRIGFNELDVAPETRHVYGWDQACALASWALDYRARALGLDVNLPAGMATSAVELRDRDQRSRLTAGDYRLFSSPDNERYAEIENWSFSSRVEDGRLVHRFDGLAVTDRYLKIHQPHTDTSYSFVLTDPRADVSVEFEPLPCDTTVMGRYDAPLVVGAGLTCLEDTVVTGPVTVGTGAQVRVTDSSITGPLRSADASAVSVCGSRITGPVSISNTTGLVVVGDSGLGCDANTVTGPVSLVSNAGAVRIGGNTIVGPLACDGNETVPVDAGQPNSVEGPKSGQCAGL